MFKGSIVWRGIVYAVLMAFGKIVTGIWLIRLSPISTSNFFSFIKRFKKANNTPCEPLKRKERRDQAELDLKCQSTLNSTPNHQGEATNASASSANQDKKPHGPQNQNKPLIPPKPKSLYPAAILGFAMIARGEVGYLIASLAESQGIFSAQKSSSSTSSSSEMYLVIIWGISICTLIGPICVGTLVRRVKKVQKTRVNSGAPDPLGVWGVELSGRETVVL